MDVITKLNQHDHDDERKQKKAAELLPSDVKAQKHELRLSQDSYGNGLPSYIIFQQPKMTHKLIMN